MKKAILFQLLIAICITTSFAQNYSLKFDGDDDYVIFPNSEAMAFPSFTIEGWFKCQPSSDEQVILMSFLNIPDKNANVTVEVRVNGLLRFNFRSVATFVGGEDLYSTTVVNDNVWHHFAAIKDGSNRLWLYIDGFPEVIVCGSYDQITTVPLFELGRNRYDAVANYRLFRGNMDDIKIWNRAKSCREIFTDFRSESSGQEPGIYSNYKFDINLDTVYDCSINQKHGARKGVFGSNNLPQYSLDIPLLTDKMCEFQLVGVEDELKNPSDGALAMIAPNPVSEFLQVELKEIQKVNGQIYALDGRLVREITLTDKVNKIDISALPSGNYLIKFSNAKLTQTHNFIKIR